VDVRRTAADDGINWRPSLGRNACLVGLCLGLFLTTSVAQVGSGKVQVPLTQSPAGSPGSPGISDDEQRAERELQAGTNLTRRGLFAEAIPHIFAARGHVANEYAASFNLALCYVGTGQFHQAVDILESLRSNGYANAEVENLLAQSYIGDSQPKRAFEALQRAASLTPANEKLYLFVGDACMDRRDYALGLKVVDLGLKNVSDSARLHYQRGLFLSFLDEFDRAREDFEQARRLSPGSEISYLSAANEELYAGNPVEAARFARQGVSKGFENPTLLTILGEALIRSGVRPGETGLAEAQAALEKAVAMRPGDASAQTSLGKFYLVADRPVDAIVHLEKARELDPGNPAVYASLAKAYQRHGDIQQAQDALATLAKLNQAQAEKINAAPGDRRAGYEGPGADQRDTAADHP
jgi:predicted Zn-dependent protease